jgi:hypothetical protein
MTVEKLTYASYLDRIEGLPDCYDRYPEFSICFQEQLGDSIRAIGSTPRVYNADVLYVEVEGRPLAFQYAPWNGAYDFFQSAINVLPDQPVTQSLLASAIEQVGDYSLQHGLGPIMPDCFYTEYSPDPWDPRLIHRECPVMQVDRDWRALLNSEQRRRLRVRAGALKEAGYRTRVLPLVPVSRKHVDFVRACTYDRYPTTYVLSIGQYAHAHAYSYMGDAMTVEASLQGSLAALATFVRKPHGDYLLQSFVSDGTSNIGLLVFEALLDELAGKGFVGTVDPSFGSGVKVGQYAEYKKALCTSKRWANTFCAEPLDDVGGPVYTNGSWQNVADLTLVTGYGDFQCKKI